MDSTTAVSTWRALVVPDIDEEELLHRYHGKYPSLAQLPTTTLTAPKEPWVSVDSRLGWIWPRLQCWFGSGVAVLSWRWDGSHGTSNPASGSKNVYRAIKYAKRTGIRYLFIDIVSIDQTLEKDQLVKQVAAFGALYRTTPVLCAYGDPENNTVTTMRRPWIQHEIMTMVSNPFGITFIGLTLAQDTLWQERRARRIRGYDMDNYYRGPDYDDHPDATHVFLRQLENTNLGLVPSIFYLLLGRIGMHDISDLIYIMPPFFSSVLSVAHSKMTREDYLMTVAFLSQSLGEKDIFAGFEGGDDNDKNMMKFSSIPFRRYKLRKPSNPDVVYEHVYLDKQKIGSVVLACGSYVKRSSLTLYDGAERHIFSALGMTEQDFQCCMEQKKEAPDSQRWITQTQISNIKIITMHGVQSRTLWRVYGGNPVYLMP